MTASDRPDGRPVPDRPPLPARMPAPRPRPDPMPLRLVLGVGGVAAASALATALLGPSGTSATDPTPTALPVALAEPSPRHVIRYVQLAPGQTAPPNATVRVQPTPKPRVVVVTTRQSGAKP